jgi:hypothetical protein
MRHCVGAGLFAVESGACTVSNSAMCFRSPNFPSNYDNYQQCTITVGWRTRLSVTAFSTESSYDPLTVNGMPYSGTSGPDGVWVAAGTTITFTSDGSSTRSGFEICGAPFPRIAGWMRSPLNIEGPLNSVGTRRAHAGLLANGNVRSRRGTILVHLTAATEAAASAGLCGAAATEAAAAEAAAVAAATEAAAVGLFGIVVVDVVRWRWRWRQRRHCRNRVQYSFRYPLVHRSYLPVAQALLQNWRQCCCDQTSTDRSCDKRSWSCGGTRRDAGEASLPPSLPHRGKSHRASLDPRHQVVFVLTTRPCTVQMQVTLPPGMDMAGQQMQVQTPSGEMTTVTVPADVPPGGQFTVMVPAPTVTTQGNMDTTSLNRLREANRVAPANYSADSPATPVVGYPAGSMPRF